MLAAMQMRAAYTGWKLVLHHKKRELPRTQACRPMVRGLNRFVPMRSGTDHLTLWAR